MLTEFNNISSLEYDKNLQAFELESIPLSGSVVIDGFVINTADASIVTRTGQGGVTLEEARVPKDFLGIQLPWDCQFSKSNYYEHQDFDKHSFIATPESKTQWLQPENCRYYCLLFSMPELRRQLSQCEVEATIGLANNIKRTDINQGDIALFSKRLEGLCNNIRFQKNISADSVELNEWYIGEIIRSILFATTPDIDRNRLVVKSRILMKARDYIHGNYAHTISVVDVANYANTTTRTLQNVFKECYGATPMRYLKNYRLYRFYQNYKIGLNKTNSASLAGLTHMGRISNEFKKLFNFPI